MIAPTQARDSETVLMESIHKLADAGGSVIHIRTREPIRAATVLRKHLIGSDFPYKEWDVVNGMRTSFTRENYTDHKVVGTSADFMQALSLPIEELRNPGSIVNAASDKVHFFVYLNPHPYIANNPMASELLQQYAAILPSTNVCTILITPEMALPDVPVGTVLVTDMPTPGAAELETVLRRVVGSAVSSFKESTDLEDADYERISGLGLGLSLYEFETFAAISIIDASLIGEDSLTADRLMDGIAVGKTQIVRQSEILELTHAEDMENIGGMQRLKDWLKLRAGCYSEKAREYGIEPPKGMVLVGVPGTGKSLAARVTASVLGVPLVKLDFASIFSKYIGDSEQRLRSALKMVEAMAPVVLFADEIDKGLGGAGGGGDSGTSSRVLGSFLTWLQDCKAPVFTVVTANRVDGLPPELLRRGRFDQVFSVGMPSDDERTEVLAIHLRKRNRNIEEFNEAEIADFRRVSVGYVPAEIESAVKDALIAGFNSRVRNKPVTMDHILTALREMVPMSVSAKDTIDRIVGWAKHNATPVSRDSDPAPSNKLAQGARVIRAGRK